MYFYRQVPPRRCTGLDLEQVAQLLGISPEVAVEYENGQRPIPVNHLEGFGRLFGLRMADLLLVDEARGIWDLKPRIMCALPASIDGGDLASFADVGKIALNLDEMSKPDKEKPLLALPIE